MCRSCVSPFTALAVALLTSACTGSTGPATTPAQPPVAPSATIAPPPAPVPSPGLHFEARRSSIPPPVAGRDRFDNEFFETLLDFDHDGRPDVVVAWSRTSAQGFATLQALHNDGGGTFIDATASVFPGGVPSLTGARNLVVADFDGDGLPDLFVADHGPDAAPFPGGQSHLFMGTKAGHLVDETQARLPSALAFTHDACAGDVNGDGASDIYLANQWPAGPPRPYLNDGGGRFTDRSDLITLGPVPDFTWIVAARPADLDETGWPGLVLGWAKGFGPPQVFHRPPLGSPVPTFERVGETFPTSGEALPADF